MSTVLTNGVIIPDNGNRNWGGDLANNWNILDVNVGYMTDVKNRVTTLENSVAENTANIQTNASNISALQTSKQDNLSEQQIANIADVTNKANDSDVVHKSGDEIISGVKTFSSSGCTFFKQIKINHNLEYGKDNPPSQAAYHNLMFSDANGWWGSYIENFTDTNGNSILAFHVRNTNEIHSRVYLECNINGSFSMYPFSNNVWELGTPTRKWKTFNGVEPSGLSLPSDTYITIDTTGFQWGANFTFTTSVNGHLFINIGSSNGIRSLSLKSGRGEYCFTNQRGILRFTMPVYKGKLVTILANSTEAETVIPTLSLFPCQGNV